MNLKELKISEKEIIALNNKKIETVESFLRKPPLHTYDFTNPLPLDLNNEETRTALEKKRPFAIVGICKNFNFSIKDKMQLLKLIIETSNGTRLFVNFVSPERFKTWFFDNEPTSPTNKIITVPDFISPFNPHITKRVNDKCVEKIKALNEAEHVTAADIAGLTSNGTDGYSYDKIDQNKECSLFTFFKLAMDNTTDLSRINSAYKWYMRGLRIDLATKKAMQEGLNPLEQMILNKPLIVGGFIEYNEEYNSFSVLNPSYVSLNTIGEYVIQYSQVKGLTGMRYKELVNNALNITKEEDFIPVNIKTKLDIDSLKVSFNKMHHPKNFYEAMSAKKRIDNERMIYFASKIKDNSFDHKAVSGIKMTDMTLMRKYVESLPYELTTDQKNAINSIYKLMNSGVSASTLLQGDVGTGKTAVAICLMLICVSSGYQAAIAVPYTTLAYQHMSEIKNIADNLGIEIAFLTSDIKGKKRTEELTRIKDGTAKIIVGTHSIFSKDVEYNNLGLVILDEEHKFGVMHKRSFEDKALPGFHQITMSATPIPRSIAKTLYDDDESVITVTEYPSNRIPIQTATCKNDATIMSFIEKEVKNNHQAYIICPSIDKNENTKIVSIEEKEALYRQYFAEKGIRMEIITGKITASEKDRVMKEFSEGKIDVLMATTVIEVGINVPNATVIAILNADRFGYSTLHQLRGRVGRGSNKSYCILQSEESSEKLEFLCTTLSGFDIAEKDLEERGTGEIFGVEQSGNNIFIETILKNAEKYKEIKALINNLSKEEIEKIIEGYENIFKVAEEGEEE